tara:strand:- start:61 stop:486 length:426 start_codon:yes stop_codon:yes gene_type:complete
LSCLCGPNSKTSLKTTTTTTNKKDDVVVLSIERWRRKTFLCPRATENDDVEKTIVVVVRFEVQARRSDSATNARFFGRIDIERGTGEDATERARERASSSSQKWEGRGEDDDDEEEDEKEEERDEKQSVERDEGDRGGRRV